MRKIIIYSISLVALILLLVGCTDKLSSKQEGNIREAAYNWIDDTSKATITSWNTATIEEVRFDKEHLVTNKTENVDIINKKTYKVTFTTTNDEILGPIIIYLDKDTLEVLGMDFRD
ncbi:MULTISPECIES: hypothetical protein [Bacteria]|uniref:hypothetical protein n=1 Tax=Bacteria TaxID=2 RepID=UPI002A835E04|nr:hypothetical protein [Clostridium sp.]MDY4252902.1 hypothetical protein [Clostridium sp.]MDY5306105.1 hypothetical protein [Fusobacterium gastrosuis]